MVHSYYPVVHDAYKTTLPIGDGVTIQQSPLSLTSHKKLEHMKLIPVYSDDYLMHIYANVGKFMMETIPIVAPSSSPLLIQVDITLSFFTATPYEPNDPTVEGEGAFLGPPPPIISIYDILLQLNNAQFYSYKLTEMLQKKSDLTKTVDRWRELKKNLIEFSKFIDKVLQHYKHRMCYHPDVVELEKIKNRLIELISGASYDEINQVFENGFAASDFDLLAAALGLNGDVSSALCEIRKGSCNHQTDQYHIKDIVCKAVEENCNKFDPDTELIDILAVSGLSSAKASIIAEELQKDELTSLQPLAYWMEWYLDFMFEYDLFLTTEYACFPHNEDELNKWFEIPTTRDIYNESTGEMEVHFNVQAYNTIDGLKSLTRDGVCYPPMEVKDGVWYHATTHDFADDIRADGIQLKKGKEKQDFSNGDGFYLTPYLAFAEEWAAKKGGPSKGAIIVFKHNINSNKYKGMDLCLEGCDEKWSRVVRYYRSGQRSRLCECPKYLAAELKRTHYIEGPMSGDQTKCISADWQPTKKKGDSNQLCIKSQELADEFSSRIDGIIFLSTNNNLQQYGK